MIESPLADRDCMNIEVRTGDAAELAANRKRQHCVCVDVVAAPPKPAHTGLLDHEGDYARRGSSCLL